MPNNYNFVFNNKFTAYCSLCNCVVSADFRSSCKFFWETAGFSLTFLIISHTACCVAHQSGHGSINFPSQYYWASCTDKSLLSLYHLFIYLFGFECLTLFFNQMPNNGIFAYFGSAHLSSRGLTPLPFPITLLTSS